MGMQSSIFSIIHETLENKDSVLTVKNLCDIAGVSRSGYYNWVNSEETRKKREAHDQEEFELILEAYNFRGYKKGVRSVHMRLLHMGTRMNLKKIRRLMRKYNLFCPFRKANPYRSFEYRDRLPETAWDGQPFAGNQGLVGWEGTTLARIRWNRRIKLSLWKSRI